MAGRDSEADNGEEGALLAELLKHYSGVIDAQRTTRNVWFRYYLLVFGLPLPLLAGYFVGKEGTPADLKTLDAPMVFFSLLSLAVALCFLGMHIRHRYNTVEVLGRLWEIEDAIRRRLPSDVKGRDDSLTVHPKGADWWVGLLHVLFASVWSAASAFFFARTRGFSEACTGWLALSAFLLTGLATYFWRYRGVNEIESELKKRRKDKGGDRGAEEGREFEKVTPPA